MMKPVAGCLTILLLIASTAQAQSLEQQLEAEGVRSLAQAARQQGDARRGAIVFYQPFLACTKCHVAEDQQQRLGPDLTKLGRDVTDEYLVQSVLAPSAAIKKGFETITVVDADGRTVAGIVIAEDDQTITLGDASTGGQPVKLPKASLEQRVVGKLSMMPQGQVNTLASRQQFLDLIRYLIELRDHGVEAARRLQPAPALYAQRPLPAYEKQLDHAGFIRDWNEESLERGEAIYERVCANCHGTHERPGSLPTSLRFAEGKFKSGSDPYTMYQTLTRGFGMMVPQAWMVPEQKYDVIHYIREAYLKTDNASQYRPVDADYLAGLPSGSSRGPRPTNIFEWSRMDYGPNLVATYEIGTEGANFAYKGNAIRLDHGAGGVSRGKQFMIFDYDTMRVAAAWSGEGFIDFKGINFDGRHNAHPRIVGYLQSANPAMPGWANPADNSFADPRLRGRDGRQYGPLPRAWAQYKGMYYHGHDVVISYTIGHAEVLELPRLLPKLANVTSAAPTADQTRPVFARTFNLGPRTQDLILQVAHRSSAGGAQPQPLAAGSLSGGSVITLGETSKRDEQPGRFTFNGASFVDCGNADDLDMRDRDYTILARFKTDKDGTIFSQTMPQAKWAPDGKSLFVRRGQLTFDVGWVGAVQAKRKVANGRWHDVALTYRAQDGGVELFVDGRRTGQGRLKPRRPTSGYVTRIGFTNDDFPRTSYFDGEIAYVTFVSRAMSADEIAAAQRDGGEARLGNEPLKGDWRFDRPDAKVAIDRSSGQRHGRLVSGESKSYQVADGMLVAGYSAGLQGGRWLTGDDGQLRLLIPAGDDPLRFTLWWANAEDREAAGEMVARLDLSGADADLARLTRGGPPRWPELLKTEAVRGAADGPFAVDVLTRPTNNPWFCRLRLTGLDFFDDGDRVAICAWDGSVWLVSGLRALESPAEARVELTWRRIASGLFQPLGLKIVEDKIFVSCRDQICILHDLNGDDEIDYYECFNNDHQVTEHFHEFAMGLQRDAAGNFYYAKSARHALTAIVPHHGTLLRVSRDGSRTDILANGFRAANGVCLNADGSFIVTDQEGHWNPKNRINWVREGGFYGNMFGYHDVTDASDDAMEQPLCWITNAFDRSPAELMWVESEKWGPLDGALLNFSYGYGKVYVVPHEQIDGQMQGGMCQLPIEQFPTGVMRGRFHAGDGQLYCCGMFAWAGAQHQPGGAYRIRYTGRPAYVPIGLSATRRGVRLKFTDPVDPVSAGDPGNYRVKVWSLERTANYGSKHYDERELQVASAQVSRDNRTVVLNLPQIQPTWCMEIQCSLKGADGQMLKRVVHNTIHSLKPTP